MHIFGIIRDVNTLQWPKMSPLYDTGQSLLSQTDYIDMNFNKSNENFFTNTQVPFEKIMSHVENLSRFNFKHLNEVVRLWEIELRKWNEITQITDARVNKIVKVLKHV